MTTADSRPVAGGPLIRRQMREELESLRDVLADENTRLPFGVPDDADPAVVRRRTQHAIDANLQLLDEHPPGEDGRCTKCRRRAVCPAGEILRIYVALWITTGGLAQRREGDPAGVSTRQLR